MKNKILTSILCLLLILAVFTSCAGDNGTQNQTKLPTERTYGGEVYELMPMSASWSYNYASVEELTEHSDIIAIVSVTGMKSGSTQGISLTTFTANIENLIYGEDISEIEIVMTGGIDTVNKKIHEIADDPLMESGDRYLIFAKENESGTYTVLSGSQGRFVIENDSVYSLNVVNEQVRASNQASSITVNGTKTTDFFAQISNALTKYNKTEVK